MSGVRNVPFLAIVFAAVFLIPALSASCPFLDVSGVFQANVTAGLQAAFPLTLTNLGLNGQLIQLSGSCPAGLSCAFSPSSQDVLVPSQTKTFTLVVDANAPGNYNFSIALAAEGNTCQVYYYNLTVNPSQNSAPSPFSVSVSPDRNESARPGESVSYQVTIHNNQNELGYARLNLVSPLKAAADFNYVDVDLPALSDKTVTVKVDVPAGTPRNVFDLLFTVDAFTGSGCCSYSYAVKRQLFVFSDQLLLNLQNVPLSCIPVKHGVATPYAFRLRNDGEVTGPYDFELIGSQAAQDASSLDADRLEIAPGDAQTLTWTIKPPSSMVLDRYSMILRIKYLDWTVSETPVCFVVDAQRSYVVAAQDSYAINRGELGEVDFTVRNNGTAAATYTVAATPPANFDFRLPEPAFTLSPGQVKTVKVLIATNILTPLGELKLPLQVSDGRIRQSVNAFLDVQSSLKPGKSLLTIENKPVSVYAGVAQVGRVGVQNLGAKTQHDVRIDVSGLPDGWAAVQDGPQSIVTGKTAYYDVQFTVPAEDRARAHKFTVLAQSAEGETVQDNLTLAVLDAPAHLDVAVTDVQRSGDSVTFSVVIYNNGLKSLTGVAVTAGNSTQSIGDLAPGEQRVAVFQGLATAPLLVQAQSNEGVQSRQVGVPLEPVGRLDVNGLMVILLVLILVLLAVAFLLRKDSLEKFTESNATTNA